MNLTAYREGYDAACDDLEKWSLTDNPYTLGTKAQADWYRGYQDALGDENKSAKELSE